MLNPSKQSLTIHPCRTLPQPRQVFVAFYQQYERMILGWGTLLVFLGLWELAPALGWVKPLFTSSPSRIFVAAQWLFAHGFWHNIGVSALEFTYGFGLSLLVGVPLGVLMGWYRRFHAMFEPLITALYVTPRVALVPMLILWFRPRH